MVVEGQRQLVGNVCVFFVHGRMSLMGDHTDYNGCFVLP
ncbi:MAG: galactokinase family protein [Bacillota bacterium]